MSGDIEAIVSFAGRERAEMAEAPTHKDGSFDGCALRIGGGRSALWAKRLFDVAFSAVILVFILPLLLTICLALILTDGRPILYRQSRLGKDGKPFDCLKFRSMVKNADEELERLLESSPEARREWTETHKLRNDPRIHPVGSFLRRTSLDELPQFINVLKGDMSVVGPRPITSAEAHRYGQRLSACFSVRPGVTGLWQVSGRNTVSYDRRVELDSEYVGTVSPLTDIRIILKTVQIVLSGTGDH